MVLLLALIIVGKAQTLLSEGFEDGIPSTWTNIDADADEYQWTLNSNESATAHSGSKYVYSRSWVGGTGALHPDNWLITPTVTIPSSGNYDLTFWVSSMQDDFPQEHYGIYISTSSNPEDLNSYTLLYENTLQATHGGSPAQTQGYWQDVTVSLAGYTGNVHIAFRHYECSDWVAICLDDIMIAPASTDPALSVTSSQIRFGTAQFGTVFGRKQFNVTGMNLTNNVTLTLPTGTPFGISSDTLNYGNTVTLTPNASGNVSDAIYVTFNPTSANYYESDITITSDAGTKTVTLYGMTTIADCSQNQTIPWYETFSATEFPTNCWTVTSTDTNDLIQDGQAYPRQFTWHRESSSAGDVASVRGDIDSYQDEHLYTPTFTLSNATGAADFIFELRTNPNFQDKVNGLDRLEVNMSLDGGNTYTTIWNFLDIQADFAEVWGGWSDIWTVRFNMDQYLSTNSQVVFDFHYESELGAGGSGYPYYIQNVKFVNYHNPVLTVNAEDTIDFFTYIGNPQPIVIPVEGRNLNTAINVATAAPFEVSANGTDYAATATLPAMGANLYVRYNPESASINDAATMTITNNYVDPTSTYPTTDFSDTVVLTGKSYDCSGTVLPISESFETEDGTVLAPNATEYCWGAIKGNTADAQNAIINSTYYAYTGNQSFRFSSFKYNAQQVYDQYLISPELTAENPMLVMFNYANASALKDETFCVGYSTTGNAISDFTWEADIVNAANTDWQLYRNAEVPADVKYVAVHYKSNRKAYLYIDNFQIMVAPSCLFPVSVHAENTGVDYADIAWTAGANETSWEIVYGVAPLNLATATPSAVNTLGTTINGLTANTHYQVALRAVCGTDATSEWSEIADFWTTTTPATVPYTQSFEDNDADRANWVLVNGNEPNYFMYGNIPGSTTGKALMITQDGSTNTYLTQVAAETLTSQYSTVWAYRDIQFPETSAAGFILSLNWKCFGEVDYDFGELFIGNATEVTNFERNENIPGFVDVNETHYTPAGLTKLDRFVNKSTMQTAAYIIPSENIAGSVKRLYFLWTNDSLSGAETPLAIDNISISIPQFANMSGIVTDADNGNVISGAVISIVSNQGFSATATSDENGHYIIEDVVAGYYTITVSANGYQTLNTGYALAEGENNVPFELTVEECAIIPTTVQYTVEDDNMILTWDAIEDGVMTQCNSMEYESAIGAGKTYTMGAYHLFTPTDLNTFNGCSINSIGGYLNGDLEYCTYTIRIWVGGNPTDGPASPSPVYEQEVVPDGITIGAWNDITLNTPYVIDGSQALWIGFHIVVDGAASSSNIYSMGVTDEGNNYEEYGNAMYFNSSWSNLTNAGVEGYNWMIRANVVAPHLTYSVLEDGVTIASGIEDAEYVVSPYDPTACYQVTTTCENGQVSNVSECAVPAVGIDNVDNAASFEIYPNPAHETVNVATTMNAQKVEVLNYLGQVIYSQNVTSNNFTLNVANYADGVYFIRISGNDGIATQKLIKK